MKLHSLTGAALFLALTATAAPRAPFGPGETLRYSAWFQIGFVSVGDLSIQTGISEDAVDGTSVLDITASGETGKTLGRLYPLQDSFRVQLRQDDMKPVWFREHDRERAYEAVKEQWFRYSGDSAVIRHRAVKNGKEESSEHRYTDGCPADPLSILYGLRLSDFSAMRPGDTLRYTYFDPDGDTGIVLAYAGLETVKLRNGERYRCHKLTFNVADGTVFSRKEPVSVWLSDDDNRIIVHAEAKLKIGYAKVDLREASGILRPLTAASSVSR